jgi:flagellar secretion chaperone FliS
VPSNSNHVQTYKETQIKTANQLKLVVMLYDGAIRHLNEALDCFQAGHRKYDAFNRHIVAAQDILSELMGSLDFDQGGSLAKNLLSLYMFMNQRLLDANIQKDARAVEEVKKFLTDLRDAWDQISNKKGLGERTAATGGINLAG